MFNWEQSRNTPSTLQDTPHPTSPTQTHTIHLPACWEATGNPLNTNTDRNPSSDSNHESWTCERTMLPAAPPCCSLLVQFLNDVSSPSCYVEWHHSILGNSGEFIPLSAAVIPSILEKTVNRFHPTIFSKYIGMIKSCILIPALWYSLNVKNTRV